ncbi:MAG: hypothetical protein EOP48_07640 [Sphingobacteriales bacterium]|nr:MAG: hypothetical protein EOP48_07640 [Sphingobacteriales bacterium]
MKIADQFYDPLKSFKIVQRTIALICLLIPLLLWIGDTDKHYPPETKPAPVKCKCVQVADTLAKEEIKRDRLGFRLSISDYAYGRKSHVFALLYTIAAMMYIFNWAVYYRSEGKLRVNTAAKHFNLLTGLCLMGVVCAPERSYCYLHYGFAIGFFLFNGLNIGYSKNTKQRSLRWFSVIVMFSFFFIPSVNSNVTYLWAEWLALLLIVYYLLRDSSIMKNKYQMEA